MSRQYHERIEVMFNPPAIAPTAFVWRGRRHVVQAVVDQWTQRLPWWRLGAQGHCAPSVLEQQVWRVEASVGAVLGAGVYDLTYDECWRLLRVAD